MGHDEREKSHDTPQGADLADLIAEENRRQDLGTFENRMVVPELSHDGLNLRTALLKELHNPQCKAHPGQNKLLERVKAEYWWPNWRHETRQFVDNCADCRRNKIPRDKQPGLLHPLPVPNKVWEKVAADGKTMPKDKHGYDYVWAFVCKFSRLIVRLPGKKDDTAETLAKRYYRHIYRLLGMPSAWLSDNAGPFVSRFLREINRLTSTKHRHGSSLHPQTQGAVKIINQALDQNLRFYINKYQDDWSEHLAAIDFAHNSSWHSSIGMSPLKLMMGSEPRDPLSQPLPERHEDEDDQAERARRMMEAAKEVQDKAHQNALKVQEAQKKQADKHRRPVDFGVGDMVFVRKTGFTTAAPTTRLDSQFAGPWRIMEERGHSYVLDVPLSFRGKNLFPADRLRKAATDPLPQQEVTPEPPVEINGTAEYEVEEILASRLTGSNRRLQYQVRCQGCDPDDEWYDAANLKNAGIMIQDFHNRHPTAAGPPMRLKEWIRAAAEDEHDADHPDDNKALGPWTTIKRRPTRHA